MKAIKFIIPLMMFLFIGQIGHAQASSKTAAVNTKAKEATCQKVCSPSTADAMVKLGLCTPEQAAKCKKGTKNVKTASTETTTSDATKVASASKERNNAGTSTTAVKSKGCAKTCEKICKSTKKKE